MESNLHSLVWSVLLECNRRVFEDTSNDVADLFFSSLQILGTWAKSCSTLESTPYCKQFIFHSLSSREWHLMYLFPSNEILLYLIKKKTHQTNPNSASCLRNRSEKRKQVLKCDQISMKNHPDVFHEGHVCFSFWELLLC